MQLKTIKTAAEAPFKGVEFIKVDGGISEVVIGGKLRVRKGDTYGVTLQVLVEAPGEIAKRYKVEATLDGFAPTVEYHESSFDADERVRHFEGLGAKVSKDYVDALISETGAVVDAPECAPVATKELEELPF